MSTEQPTPDMLNEGGEQDDCITPTPPNWYTDLER